MKTHVEATLETEVVNPPPEMIGDSAVAVTFERGQMVAKIFRYLTREEAQDILSEHYSAEQGQQVRVKL